MRGAGRHSTRAICRASGRWYSCRPSSGVAFAGSPGRRTGKRRRSGIRTALCPRLRRAHHRRSPLHGAAHALARAGGRCGHCADALLRAARGFPRLSAALRASGRARPARFARPTRGRVDARGAGLRVARPSAAVQPSTRRFRTSPSGSCTSWPSRRWLSRSDAVWLPIDPFAGRPVLRPRCVACCATSASTTASGRSPTRSFSARGSMRAGRCACCRTSSTTRSGYPSSTCRSSRRAARSSKSIQAAR